MVATSPSHPLSTVTTAPSSEPVTEAEVYQLLRIPHNRRETALVTSYIKAAREAVEAYQNRALIYQGRTLKLPCFPREGERKIVLDAPPYRDGLAITYVDSEGNSQTLASTEYQLVDSTLCAEIHEAYAKTWPVTRSQPEAVTVTWNAGYNESDADTPADAVPQVTREVVRMLAAHYYNQRSPLITGTIIAEVPFQFRTLLNIHAVRNLQPAPRYP